MGEKIQRKGEEHLHQYEQLEQEKLICENYSIVRLLGKGGEGSVYLVKHLATERLRAAKLVKHGLCGDRFHELYMLKQLHHPSLPQIIDVLENEEGVWLIMEYVKGISLSELINSGIHTAQFLEMAEQILEVLIYLHTRPLPILHLDIKPSNILIRADGRIVLIDFGTSQQYQNGMEQKHHFGTRGYAAPEQEQKTGITDVRTDIYGVGAVFYDCLYGEIPVQPLRKRVHFVTWKKTMYKMLRRCLCMKQEERYQNIQQVYRAFKRVKRLYQMQRKIKKGGAALVLLVVTILFSVKTMTAELKESKKTEEQLYMDLLVQSESLGLEQAYLCYEQASDLYPGDYVWVNQFVKRMLQDYLFDPKEEMYWNQLLFRTVSEEGWTVKELLQMKQEAYAELAYQIGLAYWYYYEDTGGKYAAHKWFGEAAEYSQLLNIQPVWTEIVQIHIKIGSYYEQLGRNTPENKQEFSAQIYWEDLTKLWNLKSIQKEKVQLKYQIAEEMLACMILYGSELVQASIVRQDLEEWILVLKQFARDAKLTDSVKTELLMQCEEAGKALERSYAQKK